MMLPKQDFAKQIFSSRTRTRSPHLLNAKEFRRFICRHTQMIAGAIGRSGRENVCEVRTRRVQRSGALQLKIERIRHIKQSAGKADANSRGRKFLPKLAEACLNDVQVR